LPQNSSGGSCSDNQLQARNDWDGTTAQGCPAITAIGLSEVIFVPVGSSCG